MISQRRIFYLAAVSLGVASIALGAIGVFAQDSNSRLPVPSEEAQAKAGQFVEQLFERDVAAAKSPSEKAALFRKTRERRVLRRIGTRPQLRIRRGRIIVCA